MASTVNISEDEFEAVSWAACELFSKHPEKAERLDKLARKINVALSKTKQHPIRLASSSTLSYRDIEGPLDLLYPQRVRQWRDD